MKEGCIDSFVPKLRGCDSAAIFALGFAFSIALGLASLTYPFGHDQAIYAHIASCVLEGDILYRDIFSLKPPLTAALHALSQSLFGHTMTSIRILDLLWMALTSGFLSLLAYRLFPQRRALAIFAGFLHAHYYYTFDYWHTAQSDGWANLPLTLAMLFIVRAYASGPYKSVTWRQLLNWAVVGVMLGFALLFKYTFVGFLPIMLLAAVLPQHKQPKSALLSVLAILAGLVVLFGVFLAVFAAWGALDAYFVSQISNITHYASLRPKWQSSSFLTKLLGFKNAYPLLSSAPVSFYLGLFGLPLGIFLCREWLAKSRWLAGSILLTTGWLAAAWASTAIQARFFSYHFLPLLPPLALFAAFFLDDLLLKLCSKLTTTSRRCVMAAVLAGITLLPIRGQRCSLVSHYVQYRHVYRVLSRQQSLEDGWQYSIFAFYGNFSIANTVKLLNYLEEESAPTDSIFSWGTNAAVYFLSERPRVSNIYSQVQITGGFGDGNLQSLLDELTRRKPRIFLVQRGDAIPQVLGHLKDSLATFRETPELLQFVEQRYRRRGRLFGFEVYFLN